MTVTLLTKLTIIQLLGVNMIMLNSNNICQHYYHHFWVKNERKTHETRILYLLKIIKTLSFSSPPPSQHAGLLIAVHHYNRFSFLLKAKYLEQEIMVRPMEGRLRSPCSDPSGHFLLIAFIWPNKYFHISLPNLIHSFLLNDESLAFRCHVSSDLFLYCSLFTSFYLLPTVWCGLNGRKKMTPLSSKTSRRRTRSVFWEESS